MQEKDKVIECLGADLSHWNPTAADEYAKLGTFVMLKMSEGESGRDKSCKRRVELFGATKPLFLYHVITAKGDMDKQIHNAVTAFNEMQALNKNPMGFVIDVEASSNPNYFPMTRSNELKPVVQFGERVADALKKRILVYCGQGFSYNFYQAVRAHDWGLWIAAYTKSKPTLPLDFWQFKNTPYDTNRFYGSISKLHSYLNCTN